MREEIEEQRRMSYDETREGNLMIEKHKSSQMVLR